MLSLITVAGAGLVLAFVWYRFWRQDSAVVGTSFRTGRAKRDNDVALIDNADAGSRNKLPAFGHRIERTISAQLPHRAKSR